MTMNSKINSAEGARKVRPVRNVSTVRLATNSVQCPPRGVGSAPGIAGADPLATCLPWAEASPVPVLRSVQQVYGDLLATELEYHVCVCSDRLLRCYRTGHHLPAQQLCALGDPRVMVIVRTRNRVRHQGCGSVGHELIVRYVNATAGTDAGLVGLANATGF